MTNEEFINRLSVLLAEAGASIDFDCSECSDTYGLSDVRIAIYRDNKEIKRVNGFGMTAGDLK